MARARSRVWQFGYKAFLWYRYFPMYASLEGTNER